MKDDDIGRSWIDKTPGLLRRLADSDLAPFLLKAGKKLGVRFSIDQQNFFLVLYLFCTHSQIFLSAPSAIKFGNSASKTFFRRLCPCRNRRPNQFLNIARAFFSFP